MPNLSTDILLVYSGPKLLSRSLRTPPFPPRWKGNPLPGQTGGLWRSGNPWMSLIGTFLWELHFRLVRRQVLCVSQQPWTSSYFPSKQLVFSVWRISIRDGCAGGACTLRRSLYHPCGRALYRIHAWRHQQSWTSQLSQISSFQVLDSHCQLQLGSWRLWRYFIVFLLESDFQGNDRSRIGVRPFLITGGAIVQVQVFEINHGVGTIKLLGVLDQVDFRLLDILRKSSQLKFSSWPNMIVTNLCSENSCLYRSTKLITIRILSTVVRNVFTLLLQQRSVRSLSFFLCLSFFSCSILYSCTH